MYVDLAVLVSVYVDLAVLVLAKKYNLQEGHNIRKLVIYVFHKTALRNKREVLALIKTC